MHKLVKNNIYGKTMEKLRNRTDIRPVNNKKDYLKCTSKPSYISRKIFESKLFAIQKKQNYIKA